MTISADTAAVVEFIEYSSGNNLRQKDMLSVILEIAAENNLHKDIETLAFNGSALYLIIKSARNDLTDAQAIIQAEVINLVALLKATIANISDCSDESDVKDKIRSDVLSENEKSQANLFDLCHDLHFLKIVQNTFKSIKNKELNEEE